MRCPAPWLHERALLSAGALRLLFLFRQSLLLRGLVGQRLGLPLGFLGGLGALSGLRLGRRTTFLLSRRRRGQRLLLFGARGLLLLGRLFSFRLLGGLPFGLQLGLVDRLGGSLVVSQRGH